MGKETRNILQLFKEGHITEDWAVTLLDPDWGYEDGMNVIKEKVCDFYEIPKESIVKKTRERKIVKSRQIGMFLSRCSTKLSTTQIGKGLGGKDHATVLHACKTINDQMFTDQDIAFQIVCIASDIGIPLTKLTDKTYL